MTKHKRDKARKRHNKVIKAGNIYRNTPAGVVRYISELAPEATPEEIQAQRKELAKGGY